MTDIGYARVSTEDQELTLQIDALERAGCWNIYKERGSASKKRILSRRAARARLMPIAM